MLTFFLLILCINIDALSYGVAGGIKKRKFSALYVLLVCVMSTIMFAVPLYLSKFVFQYFDELICRIINGVILMLMGIIYLLPKDLIKSKLRSHKKPNYSQNTNDINSEFKETLDAKIENKEKSIENSMENNQKFEKITFVKCFLECFVISVDAIFTAFLSNFTDNYYILAVAFYALTNYLAIYFGNRVLYKINALVKFNLSFISGLIFILLGVLKICGF